MASLAGEPSWLARMARCGGARRGGRVRHVVARAAQGPTAAHALGGPRTGRYPALGDDAVAALLAASCGDLLELLVRMGNLSDKATARDVGPTRMAKPGIGRGVGGGVGGVGGGGTHGRPRCRHRERLAQSVLLCVADSVGHFVAAVVVIVKKVLPPS